MVTRFGLLTGLLLTASAAGAQARYTPVLVGPIREMGYSTFRTVDSLQRDITFFVTDARPRAGMLPLVVYVHGSGHQSNFLRSDDGVVPTNGHATLADVVAERARVVVIEKPGVSLFDRGESPARAAFREEHTLERWTEAVVAATTAAGRLPGVDSTRILVVGHSEGGADCRAGCGAAAQRVARGDSRGRRSIAAAGSPRALAEWHILQRHLDRC